MNLGLEGELGATVDEGGDSDKVAFDETTGSEGRGANSDTTRGEGALVARDSVLVDRDADAFEDNFDLASRETERADVPEDKVVVSATSDEEVAELLEGLAEGDGILLDLGDVLSEGGRVGLEEGDSDGGDRVLVGATLDTREDGVVDLVLEGLAVEDQASTGSTEGLVRGGRNDVAKLEGVIALLGGDDSTDVGHIAEQVRSVDVSDLVFSKDKRANKSTNE